MRINYETVIIGEQCVLVPYHPTHVLKYHEWMQDEALLEATASEPLSLEEEYEMQESWRVDDSKCTFIVLARELLTPIFAITLDSLVSNQDINEFIQITQYAMVGDVNMFLSDESESDSDTDDDKDAYATTTQLSAAVEKERKEGNEQESDTNNTPSRQAELDIMIAEPAFRGKGLGHEAATLMMLYGATCLNLRRIFSKINADNEASLRLFRTKLGFRQCAYAECFHQVEMELRAESSTQLVDLLHANSRLNNYKHGKTLELQTLRFFGGGTYPTVVD